MTQPNDKPMSEGPAAASPTKCEAPRLVLLSDVVPDAILEIRYYGTYNFLGRRVAGYLEPCALLTPEAARALRVASDEAGRCGYRLKVFDAYRPQRAVDDFVAWASDVDDASMRPYFYPSLDKAVLFEQGYIAARSSHSRGSTVDLTLFDMAAGREACMGSPFDFFGEVSHGDYEGVTEEQRALRMLLQRIMVTSGFEPYDQEWWHFTLKGEPYPDTYFDVPVCVASASL